MIINEQNNVASIEDNSIINKSTSPRNPDIQELNNNAIGNCSDKKGNRHIGTE